MKQDDLTTTKKQLDNSADKLMTLFQGSPLRMGNMNSFQRSGMQLYTVPGFYTKTDINITLRICFNLTNYNARYANVEGATMKQANLCRVSVQRS